MKKVLIIVNRQKEKAAEAVEFLGRELRARGIGTEVYGFLGKPEGRPDASGCDAVITLGGDGTVLFASRAILPAPLPIFPINLGRLGFIAELKLEGLGDCLDAYEAGEIAPSRRFMIEMTLIRESGERVLSHGLNDGVVSGSGVAKIVNLDFAIDGASFGSFLTDGMIVASPTGSTAYSLAAGGPVLSPELGAMVVNPICPFTLTNRPIVVSGDSVVDIRVLLGQRTTIALTIDGQEYEELREGDVVRFKRSPYEARLVYSNHYAFHAVLKSKLSWAGGQHA